MYTMLQIKDQLGVCLSLCYIKVDAFMPVKANAVVTQQYIPALSNKNSQQFNSLPPIL